MNIIHVSAECYPIAKVGGLADVVGALPKYQTQAGHKTMVVMPAYNTKFMQENEWVTDYVSELNFGGITLPYTILKEKHNKLGFWLYCVLIEGLTDRKNIYSEPDDTERFLAFQLATLSWISQWQYLPDILHCHDHHTGLMPFMKQYCGCFKRLKRLRTIFTIHNGAYQGWFDWQKSYLLPAYDTWAWGLLDWSGVINPMASAVRCADAVTTVSHSYMFELMQYAHGLEQLFQAEAPKCFGILNGIDVEVWNPEQDRYLDHHYNIDNVSEGKAQHKKEICETFGINAQNPLIAFIGRLVHEKGADLLAKAMGQAMYETQGRISFIALGSGNFWIENDLKQLKNYCPGIYNYFTGYDERLSHKIYAAADFIIMPSRIEPCGLNQMYAMRYGTIPMVRRIGGLQDTVVDIGDYDGYGICFHQASTQDIIHAVHRATHFYHNQTFMHYTRQRIMSFDFSWENAQQKYVDIYQKVINL